MGIEVKKIGVNFNPSPTLLLLYSEGGKARRREMPLRCDARIIFVQHALRLIIPFNSGIFAKTRTAVLLLLDSGCVTVAIWQVFLR